MINKIKSNFILKSTLLVTAASLFSNVFSYLFQLVLGRSLSVEEYGILIALFSIHSIFLLPAGIVASSITKVVSEVKDVNYPQGLSNLYYTLLKINILFAVFVILLMYLGKSYLFDYLNIDFTRVLLPFLTFVFFSLIFSHTQSFLQALKRFKAVSLLGFFTAFSKFVAGLLVYFLNVGLYATFLILTAFTFLSSISGYLLLLKNINKKIKSFSKDNLSKIYKFSIASSFALIGINLMLNNDVILVKHLFSSDVAGYYASSAVIGRIIFYGVSPVAVVFFPICAERFHQKQDYITPMFKALATVGVFAFIGSVIFYFFPALIVGVLFGQKYISAVQYLPYYSIYMFLYSIFAVFTWLLVSVSKLKLASLALVLAALQYATVKLFFNQSPPQILMVFSVYVFLGLVVYTVFMYKDINKFIFKNAN